eukprot:TRINITY_DN65671_c5_g1_i1.p1 TRINITY_DN65671_c5_g1~~TRINITY_DN65671_c5_g1_i1.p1  ORF type:complete len:171 (-),score=106.18 TRINITY_DN65671_c5_g1_i1:121-633(-)
MTDEDLAEVFGAEGKVAEARIVRDRRSNRSRGYGFVTMESEEDAARALAALNGREVQERELRVEFAKSTGPTEPADGEKRPRRRRGGRKRGKKPAGATDGGENAAAGSDDGESKEDGDGNASGSDGQAKRKRRPRKRRPRKPKGDGDAATNGDDADAPAEVETGEDSGNN